MLRLVLVPVKDSTLTLTRWPLLTTSATLATRPSRRSSEMCTRPSHRFLRRGGHGWAPRSPHPGVPHWAGQTAGAAREVGLSLCTKNGWGEREGRKRKGKKKGKASISQGSQAMEKDEKDEHLPWQGKGLTRYNTPGHSEKGEGGPQACTLVAEAGRWQV